MLEIKGGKKDKIKNKFDEHSKYTLTAWNTSIAGWPKSPFCPFSPGKPCV